MSTKGILKAGNKIQTNLTGASNYDLKVGGVSVSNATSSITLGPYDGDQFYELTVNSGSVYVSCYDALINSVVPSVSLANLGSAQVAGLGSRRYISGNGRVVESDGKYFTSGIKYLTPTGNDDATLVAQYINDMAASGEVAGLDGDFIIGSQILLRAGKTTTSGKGIGLNVQGKGVGNTRLLCAGSDTIEHIRLVCDSSTLGQRQYFTKISGMSIIRAPSGIPNPDGTVSGIGIVSRPYQAGEVLHTPTFKDLFISGFDTSVILSDCTLPEFESVWFYEHNKALLKGYNLDLVKFKHCMFGSEQFGASYRNNMYDIVDTYLDAFHTSSDSDCVEFEQCWFMKHAAAASVTKKIQVSFNNCYFEGMRQYVDSSTSTEDLVLGYNNCHFSLSSDNDSASYPKSNHGPSHALNLRVRGCTGTAYSPLGGYFGLSSSNTTVDWSGNNLFCSGSGNSKHLLWTVAGSVHGRQLGAYGRGTYGFAGTTGMSKTSGPEITYTAATAGTIAPTHIDGDYIKVGALTGNLTINPSSSSPYNPLDGTVMTYQITSDATTGSTYNVTFGSSFIMGTTWTNATATGQTCVVKFERRNGKWVQIGYGNKWF